MVAMLDMTTGNHIKGKQLLPMMDIHTVGISLDVETTVLAILDDSVSGRHGCKYQGAITDSDGK